MTDQEMATALKSKGWKCEEPWTAANCGHPQELRLGTGSIDSDGSGSMSWTCRRCGTSESYSWAATLKHQQLQCWN